MSTVPDDIMDGFAVGIQAVLRRDWPSLTDSFIKTGFVKVCEGYGALETLMQ